MVAEIIDLNRYRYRREEEGTWPPTDDAYDYWRSRRPKKKEEPKRRRTDDEPPKRSFSHLWNFKWLDIDDNQIRPI